MAKLFSIERLAFETREARVPEFSWRTSPRLGRLANSKYLQIDIRALDPGKFSFPYHFHRRQKSSFLFFPGKRCFDHQRDSRECQKEILFLSKKVLREHTSSITTVTHHACISTFERRSGSMLAEYPDSRKDKHPPESRGSRSWPKPTTIRARKMLPKNGRGNFSANPLSVRTYLPRWGKLARFENIGHRISNQAS
jgi:hypothetical protein